jgi:hypothetical protein
VSDRSLLFTLDGHTLRPTAVQPLTAADGSALDSEAVVVDADGTRLITSETEPSIGRYPVGSTTPTEELPVPLDLRVAPPGRATKNGSFEGLTRVGDLLTASMERPLRDDQDNVLRFQTWTRVGGHFGLAAQYGYRVDFASAISEIAALGDGRLLVLERGYLPGIGNTIRLYLADPRRASDVAAVTKLSERPGLTLISKTLVADLVHCPSLGATNRETQANPLLDNVEGMTVLSRRPDGTTRLLLVSDDNASKTQTTRLYWLTARIS